MNAPRPRHAVLLRDPRSPEAPRRNRGLVADSLPAEAAEAMAAELSAAGVPAVAVPVSLVDPLPPEREVLRGELSGDGFDCLETRGRLGKGRWSWSRLRVIAAGRPGAGAPFADLVFGGPEGRLRLRAGDFDFSALGEGMGASAEKNLEALVERLRREAPRALTTLGVREPGARYATAAELEREARWLAALRALEIA